MGMENLFEMRGGVWYNESGGSMKAQALKKGDKIAIVSLSAGLLGMPFCKHELDLGIKRLKEMGLEPVFMPNALKGIDFISQNPQKRAQDLKQAFMDDSIKAIITAIGGDDSYKTIPYLMEDAEFKKAVKTHPKIFTGFSDTTNTHLMLNKLGLSTFYGPCFMVDIAELDKEMLPYTKEYFLKFFGREKEFIIQSSPIWYSDRASYAESELNKPRLSHKEQHGFECLNGGGVATGKLYGGCLDIIYYALSGIRSSVEAEIYKKYKIMPTESEWKQKILFIETSESCPEPKKLEEMLQLLKEKNILSLVQGVIVGKPMDEKYYEEYKLVYKKVFADLSTPVLYNVNFGHAVPRCIVPYDAKTKVDFDKLTITITEPILN